jgi:signal-transduction protein with cAMP-binding, CBS, and nucleotidyltransferase domain
MATDYAPTPVEDFLDPDDPAMFPRLTPEQVEYLAGIGAQQTFGRGDQVFGHGQRETPLYIVQSGAVDIIDHAPEGDRYFTQCQERTFIGDLSMFTGEEWRPTTHPLPLRISWIPTIRRCSHG